MSGADLALIRDLVDRYSFSVTVRDEAGIAATFVPDGIWAVGPPYESEIVGRDKIAAVIMENLAAKEFIVHMTHATVTEVDGDRARSRTIIHELLRATDRETGFSMFGLFDDEVVRVDGQWLFKKRTFTPTYIDREVPPGELP